MSIPEPGAPADIVLWRAYVPRWAHEPLSGEGAARYGGRWNDASQRCLYAARELSTAWAEYNQGFVQHPALIAQLAVREVRLFDLTEPAGLAAAGVSDDIHRFPWREMMSSGREPPTHMLAGRLRKVGWDGVIYPSFMSPGGSCVALWQWNEKNAGPQVEVVDPEQRLPRNPRSWI